MLKSEQSEREFGKTKPGPRVPAGFPIKKMGQHPRNLPRLLALQQLRQLNHRQLPTCGVIWGVHTHLKRAPVVCAWVASISLFL